MVLEVLYMTKNIDSAFEVLHDGSVCLDDAELCSINETSTTIEVCQHLLCIILAALTAACVDLSSTFPQVGVEGTVLYMMLIDYTHQTQQGRARLCDTAS